MKFWTCATSEDSDQPALSRSLIRIFSGHVLDNQKMQNITKTCLFKCIENFTTKKWNFSDKKIWYFSCFCSKHWLYVLVWTASNIYRLYVLVWIASGRRFERVPTIYVFSINKKNNVNPFKPSFYYLKWDLRGSKLYRYLFVMGFFMRTTWTLIRLRECAGWFESSLGAHVKRCVSCDADDMVFA